MCSVSHGSRSLSTPECSNPQKITFVCVKIFQLLVLKTENAIVEFG